MSFSISLGGPAAEVLSKLEALPAPFDSAQYDLVKTFLQEHINTFPSESGLSVSVSGHHYGQNASLSLNLGHDVPAHPATDPSPAPTPVQ